MDRPANPRPDDDDLPVRQPAYQDWVNAVNEQPAPPPRRANKRTGY